jgi:hypothetical protein
MISYICCRVKEPVTCVKKHFERLKSSGYYFTNCIDIIDNTFPATTNNNIVTCMGEYRRDFEL